MQDDAATLQCPNEFCKAPNCQVDKFCKVCSTPLIKRYLWAVGDAIEADQPGLIGDRYLLKSDRILLDTKPGLVAATPFAEISQEIKPYLRLISYQLHIPQVYGWLSLETQTVPILLLEQAPIYADNLPLAGQLMPLLTKVWQDATPMRQLNWLWQMAQLWQPLSAENVGSSLLNPQLIRVEGALIKLLQLQPDQTPPTLMQLGLMWQQLVAAPQPSITQFLAQLSDALIQGEVQSSEEIIALLDRGIAELGRSPAHTLTISAYTDTGPSRQRNEDACYPASGTTTTTDATQFNSSLMIVCDGIGGHEGGNIASNLAIETIQQQLQTPPTDAFLDPITLSNYLENSTRVANDKISQRNDAEHRHGRQRMGTTLVMALARAHEIYITHVGDSRAYLITRTSCHQVTLDDDVASREVRLGYALYRDALQQPASGSLVQALGMSSSPSLHPTVQRFILDEDCIFLLCSDGLSDYDRVEQSWQEILPVLDGKLDVATATQRLVEIGNTQNGHDNVTVGLVHCQVKFSEVQSLNLFAVDSSISITNSPTLSSWEDNNTLYPSITATKNTRLLPSQNSPQRHLIVPLLLGLILLVSLAGGLIGYLSKQKSPTTARYRPSNIQSPSSFSPVEPQINSTPVLKKGSLIRTKDKIVLSQTKPPEVIPVRQGQSVNFIQKVLPIGSVLQVIDQQQISQQDYWLNLQVCSTPSINTGVTTKSAINAGSKNAQSSPATITPIDPTNLSLLQPSNKGWIRATEIKRHYLPVSDLEVNQKINCPNSIEK